MPLIPQPRQKWWAAGGGASQFTPVRVNFELGLGSTSLIRELT